MTSLEQYTTGFLLLFYVGVVKYYKTNSMKKYQNLAAMLLVTTGSFAQDTFTTTQDLKIRLLATLLALPTVWLAAVAIYPFRILFEYVLEVALALKELWLMLWYEVDKKYTKWWKQSYARKMFRFLARCIPFHGKYLKIQDTLPDTTITDEMVLHKIYLFEIDLSTNKLYWNIGINYHEKIVAQLEQHRPTAVNLLARNGIMFYKDLDIHQ
jgi:hypothetical protein